MEYPYNSTNLKKIFKQLLLKNIDTKLRYNIHKTNPHIIMKHRILIILLYLYSTTLVISQNDVQNLNSDLELARFTFHRTYFEKASDQFFDFISNNPNNSLAYGYLAIIDYMLYKNPDDKIRKADSLLKHHNSDYLFTKALLAFAKQDFSNTIEFISQHLAEHPDDKYALHVLGFSLIDIGETEKGLKTLETLIQKQKSKISV